MGSRSTAARARTALVTGAATTLYYATPDVVRSRTARAWIKACLTAVTFAASVPDLRAARDAGRASDAGAGAAGPRDVPASQPVGFRLAGVVAAALGSAAVGTIVWGERWIFDRGEARAAAGTRLPHTRTAILLGVLAAGLTLVPVPRPVADDVPAA